MTKPVVNRKRGEFALLLGDDWIVLKANFANIAQFEDTTGMGIYELASKVAEAKVRMTDIINVYYIFMSEADRKVYTQDDIALKLMSSDPKEGMNALATFLAVMFNIDESAVEAVVNAEALEEPKKS